MKTKEELNVLKNEFSNLNQKLNALSDEELDFVTGGAGRDEHNGVILVASARRPDVSSVQIGPDDFEFGKIVIE